MTIALPPQNTALPRPKRLVKPHPHTYLQLSRQYGDILSLPFVGFNIRLFSSPGAASIILSEKHGISRKVQDDPDSFFYKVVGDGLVSVTGDEWRWQRRKFQPLFTPAAIKKHIPLINSEITRFVQEWIARNGETVDVGNEMMRLAIRIASAIFFSPITDTTSGTEEHIRRIVGGIGVVPPLNPIARHRFWQSLKWLEAHIEQVADGMDDDSFFKQVAEMLPDKTKQERLKFLRDQVLAFFLGSAETTAAVLAWTLYVVSTHQDVAENLTQETQQQPERPQYMENVLREVMRLYPPVWLILRQVVAEEGAVIDGYYLPNGTAICLSPYVLHRRYDVWGKDADEFRPERWDEIDPDRYRHVYIPFAAGPHTCIGNFFAMQEISLALPSLLSHFKLTVIRPPSLQVGATLSPRRFLGRIEVNQGE